MKIFFDKNSSTKELDYEGKISDLLKQFKINSNEVVIIKNDNVVTEEESVKNEDSVKILSVVSGG